MKTRLLGVMIAACLLSACGKEESAPAATATPAATPTAPAATTPTTSAPTPAASTETASKPAEDKVVHVYNWSDYVAEDTLQKFEEKTGIKVVYDVYDGNEVLEAKLMAGGSGYDVVFPSARPFAQRHIASGIYAKLDRSQLGGWGRLDPAIMSGLTDIDAGNAHIVPYMWGTTGIGYNVTKIRERLGAEFEVDSWSVLFAPETAAKLADCGIALLDDEQEAFGAAMLWKGLDPNTSDGSENEVVKSVFDAIRPHVRYFHSSRYIDDLANGEVCIAMGYSGDVLQAADRASEAENGVELAYVIPKEGALRWVDVMAIPSDAPHPGNAHAFIDFLLQPEVIASITDYVAYANPNVEATALIDEEIRNDPGVYPPESVRAKLVDPRAIPDAAQRTRVRTWTSIKTGQ